jgi:hypothetical protein
LVNFVFSLKLLLLLFPADFITGSTFIVSLISLLVELSLAAMGFEMNFDLMLLDERRSPRWKIDFHECVFRLFQLLLQDEK